MQMLLNEAIKLIANLDNWVLHKIDTIMETIGMNVLKLSTKIFVSNFLRDGVAALGKLTTTVLDNPARLSVYVCCDTRYST